MVCVKCKHTIHRARIMDGQDFCLSCAPLPTDSILFTRDLRFPQTTAAHVKDIMSRKLAEDGKTVERKTNRRYIF